MHIRQMSLSVAQTLIAIFIWMTVSVFDPVLAAPGDLDPSFFTGALPALPLPGSGGPFPPNYVGDAAAVAIQQDGKILVALNVIQCGTSPLGLGCSPGYAAVIRYNADGSIDTGFGSGGIATSPLNQSASLTAFLLQSDGNIVVGIAGFPVAASVMRFNTSGRPDITFGTQGIALVPSYPTAIAEQADGKLLVAITTIGTSSNTSSVLRLNADGLIDSSYGQSGIAPLALPLYVNAQAFMAVQPTGELLITATSGPTSGAPAAVPPVNVFIERLTADGAPDPSFGNGNGVAPIAFTNTPPQFLATAEPVGLFLQQNGEVLIAGMQNAPTDQIGQFALVQLTANGAYDLAFGSGGRLISAAPTQLNFVNAVQQSDGKVIFSGTRVTSYGNSTLFFTRLNPDGSPDPEFGNCGEAKLVTAGLDIFGAAPLALQADGKIVFANPNQDPALLRVLGGNATAVSAASNTNPAPVGLPITLSATVAGGATLTGTFTITDFEAPIAGCTSLTVAVPACLVVLGVGVHAIVATYSADAQNPPGISCPITQYVDPPGLTTTVEYLHAVFNDYFITTNPDEVQALDGSLVWHRTGQHFLSHTLDQLDGALPVCRFWSGQTYAPQSTHFFTSDAAECATLMQSNVWIYEGTVFGLTPASAEGDCAAGTEPLYRLYNNGQGGAPNHRYLTNSAQWGMMIKFYGWIPEGAGVGVIGCV